LRIKALFHDQGKVTLAKDGQRLGMQSLKTLKVSDRMLKRLIAARNGNFTVLFGLCMPAVLMSAGLALDVTALTAARTSLQNSTDAALLAASRYTGTDKTREQVFNDFLLGSIASDPSLSNPVMDFDEQRGLNHFTTKADVSADVGLHIMHLFGHSARVAVIAKAREATDAVEVVLVLDNTGSMAGSRINALRVAAKSLVDILEQAKIANPERQIRISLVPFVTAVNIGGEGFKWDWIDEDASAAYHGINFEESYLGGWGSETAEYSDGSKGASKNKGKGKDKGKKKNKKGPPEHSNGKGPKKGKGKDNAGGGGGGDDSLYSDTNHLALFHRLNIPWKGCVEARPRAIAVDASPTLDNPDTLFVPYFAPDEPDTDPSRNNATTPIAGNNSANLNNSYLRDGDYGDVSGMTAEERHFAIQGSVEKYKASNLIQAKPPEAGKLTGGPNRACPTPVVPLTADFNKLRTEIAKMVEWNGGGTNVSEGLAWGTRVLSPNEPFNQADPFMTEGTKKYVVLLTDGENVVYGASGTPNKSDYGAYGFMADERFNGKINQGQAAREVDGWVKANCDLLNAREVEIFTILLQSDTAANRALYSHCATYPQNYYPTNDVSQLESVFRSIANSVAGLHFTQ
jgi:Flp pilus assembly protein TadG